ncbi:nicotinate-nucleotide adenylyltransferase [Ectobacillus sp. sgz5001026]|uniref:nicotinate-nucleotide adenylyltransferase n=1 Tax=Ectobacillus sp. sgz5001026 TaxID=3242473 RepID=UPI0036D409B0
MNRIGIIGGTFDPPHNGHLLIANEAYHALQLDEIWFMPNKIPPHKLEKDVASTMHRVEMLKQAIDHEPHFSICLIELERQGPSYTYDTVIQLKKSYPEKQFYFIIGGDMVEYLPKWFKIDELLELIQFVGVTRPGYSLQTPYNIKELEIPEFAVSSSFIRDRFSSGGTTKYLVPKKVQTYIERNGLYGAGTSVSNRA